MENAHARTPEQVIRFFNVDPETGLSDHQIKENQAKYGLNGRCKGIIWFDFRGLLAVVAVFGILTS